MKDGIYYKMGLLLLGVVFTPVWLSAQSITASFDPTNAVEMPAAASWRETTGLGFAYREASGKRELNGEETHKFDVTGTTANIHLKMSNISLDMGYAQKSNDTTVETLDNGPILLNEEVSRVNLALLGNDFVSIGLGARDNGKKEFVMDASDDTSESTESSIIGSISVKTLDFLYLGGGYERTKKKEDGKVENEWNTVIFGASALFGELGSTRLRLEYSYASSPETKSDSQGDLLEANHDETTETRYSAELMLSGLLFVGRGTEKNMYLANPYPFNGKTYDQITVSTSEGGVLWIPPSGIVLGFFFATTRLNFNFEDEYTEFRINLAYLFE